MNHALLLRIMKKVQCLSESLIIRTADSEGMRENLTNTCRSMSSFSVVVKSNLQRNAVAFGTWLDSVG